LLSSPEEFSSYYYKNASNVLLLPAAVISQIDGGHAVVAVGYDAKILIKNEMWDKDTKGALFIRNSWGVEWGEKGYGYLPYDYVTTGLAEDCWTLIQQGWIDTGQFGE
jgi:C1A family cysteine protease